MAGRNRKGTFLDGCIGGDTGPVKQECPDDKYPALLRTSRDDIDECPITTDTHFIVVVKIKEYLLRSSADSATSYFARITKTQISGLSKLKEVVLKGKAYVGGKGIENTGGNLVDFLMANDFTRNALLIEIKTPMTPLLGPLYRGDIHNISSELSDAVQQSSNYRQQLSQNYHSLAASSSHEFHAFNPPSLVIAGCNEELAGPEKTKAFELYRNGLKDVQIITFRISVLD